MRHKPSHPSIAIPGFWSAEQALDVAAFLECIISAIWLRHGDAMVDRLRVANYRAGAMPRVDSDAEINDDDIPF